MLKYAYERFQIYFEIEQKKQFGFLVYKTQWIFNYKELQIFIYKLEAINMRFMHWRWEGPSAWPLPSRSLGPPQDSGSQPF